MKSRSKKDFTRKDDEMAAYVSRWTENLAHEDTSITMSYNAGDVEATFWHPGNRFMVAYLFDGVQG